jgi:hypothetical protein
MRTLKMPIAQDYSGFMLKGYFYDFSVISKFTNLMGNRQTNVHIL